MAMRIQIGYRIAYYSNVCESNMEVYQNETKRILTITQMNMCKSLFFDWCLTWNAVLHLVETISYKEIDWDR